MGVIVEATTLVLKRVAQAMGVLLSVLLTTSCYSRTGASDQESKCPEEYIFFNQRGAEEVFLVDAAGRVRWSWRGSRTNTRGWHHVELMPDGGLVALTKDIDLVRLDKDSNELWKRKARFHHDVILLDSGTLASIVRKSEWRTIRNLELPVLAEYIVLLDLSTGATTATIDVTEPFVQRLSDIQLGELKEFALGMDRSSHYEFRNNSPADFLHLNSIQSLEGWPGLNASSQVWLLSFRTLDLVAVFDPSSREVIWEFGPGVLSGQHTPVFSPSTEELIIFDNGVEPKRSRVVSVALETKEMKQLFPSDGNELPFTESRGSVQLLCNKELFIGAVEQRYSIETVAGARPRFIDWFDWYRKMVNPRIKKSKFELYRIGKVPVNDSRLPPMVQR